MDSEKYDAITFDVYGTLIDWEPTILATSGRWINAKKAVIDDAALLDWFDRARAHYQALSPARPYPRVLRSAFAYIADELDLDVDLEERTRFGNSVGDWPPYPDSVTALARLSFTNRSRLLSAAPIAAESVSIAVISPSKQAARIRSCENGGLPSGAGVEAL